MSEQDTIKAAAEAEERQAADLMKRVQEQQNGPEAAAEIAEVADEDEPLISILSKGQDYLHQKMREKMARDQAREENYSPPPRTERQMSVLEEEQAAGRRAAARHQAELDARPPRPHDPTEGTSMPVHRPGSAVPGPYDGANGGFVAGKGAFSPDA